MNFSQGISFQTKGGHPVAGNDDIHKSLNEFEIQRDPTMDHGVGCP